jgi:23S rRNA (adenine2503-C2)-methyltransferase
MTDTTTPDINPVVVSRWATIAIPPVHSSVTVAADLSDRTENQPKSFFNSTRLELEKTCKDFGAPLIHARDMFRSAYKDVSPTPWSRKGLPKPFAKYCEKNFLGPSLRIISEHLSQYDRSVKFVVELADLRQVEMVLMPEAKRVTLCVSSQVGCAQACVFCHTGRMGLARNLDASEIVGQVWLANEWIAKHPNWLVDTRLPVNQRITNIVFMGMGEPLDNVPAVAKTISILTDPYGLNLAIRRISVSTAGHLDGLDELVKLHPNVRLAISVHSAIDTERSKIMPINRRWPLAQLIEKLRSLPTQQANGLLIQYTLISGVNDSLNHADKLVQLLEGLKVKINIIPLNPVGPSRMKAPETQQLELFRDQIYKSGVQVMVRYSKGQDIAAACGQLVIQTIPSKLPVDLPS